MRLLQSNKKNTEDTEGHRGKGIRKLCYLLFFTFYLLIVPCSLLFANLSLDETLNELSQLSQNANAQFRWDPLLQDGVFHMGEHQGVFSAASRKGQTGYLLFNNRELFTVPLPYNENGSLVFPQDFVATLKNAFTRSFAHDASRFRISTIIIDPGHGGRDPGAVSRQMINGRTVQVMEKDIVLRTGLLLRDLLTRSFPDRNIMMTRETDVFLSLEQRSDMANAVPVRDNEAIIFVSIHANSAFNTNARGFEVWHITENHRRTLIDPSRHNYSPDIMAILNAMLEAEVTTESIMLANSILGGLEHEFGDSLPSRGRMARDWFVVRNSRMPAVLVELGFVSNQQDAILMTCEIGLQRFARALYNGIRNFIDIFER